MKVNQGTVLWKDLFSLSPKNDSFHANIVYGITVMRVAAKLTKNAIAICHVFKKHQRSNQKILDVLELGNYKEFKTLLHGSYIIPGDMKVPGCLERNCIGFLWLKEYLSNYVF